MSRLLAVTLFTLAVLAISDTSNVSAQEAVAGESTNARIILPPGFFPKYVDKQTYSAQKVQRLANNPAYFKDKPDQISEGLAYLEYMFDEILHPNNLQAGAIERQKYSDMRTNIRTRIGVDADASPSVAIAALYTISKIDPDTLKQGGAAGGLRSVMENQGLTASEVLSLTEVFDTAGFELESILTVGDAISDALSSAGLESSLGGSIVEALGLDASTSFADAVAAFNSAFGTSLGVDQAKEALGISDNVEAGN